MPDASVFWRSWSFACMFFAFSRILLLLVVLSLMLDCRFSATEILCESQFSHFHRVWRKRRIFHIFIVFGVFGTSVAVGPKKPSFASCVFCSKRRVRTCPKRRTMITAYHTI